MNDTLIFLVLAGIALVFRWLNGRDSAPGPKSNPSADRPPNEPPPRNPMPRAPAGSEEEKIRRFMEALGAPAGSRPPPPVRPRPVVAPRRVVTPSARQKTPSKPKRTWAQPLPPLVTVPAESAPPPRVMVPESLPSTTVEPILLPVEPVASPFVRQEPISARRALPVPGVSLGEMLRSAGSARQAMILREVLGPPRGLQAMDFANGRPF